MRIHSGNNSDNPPSRRVTRACSPGHPLRRSGLGTWHNGVSEPPLLHGGIGSNERNPRSIRLQPNLAITSSSTSMIQRTTETLVPQESGGHNRRVMLNRVKSVTTPIVSKRIPIWLLSQTILKELKPSLNTVQSTVGITKIQQPVLFKTRNQVADECSRYFRC